MQEFKIGDFNSYFELFVAFTFAYNGLEGFKDYVNGSSFKAYEEIHQNYTGILSKLSSSITVLDNDLNNNRLEDWKIRKFNEANGLINEMNSIIKIADTIYDGSIFRTQFLFTGGIFLSLIILSGFGNLLGDTVSFITLVLISITSIAYSFYSSKIIKGQAQGLNINYYKEKLMSSKFVLTLYAIFYFGFIGFALYFKIAWSSSILKFCEPHINTTYLVTTLKVIIIISFLVISALPYYKYYQRSIYCKKYFDKRIEGIKPQLESLINDIEVVSERKLNAVIAIPSAADKPEPIAVAEKKANKGKKTVI